MPAKTMFTPGETKRGERKAGTHGLNYNSRKKMTREELQKKRNKWITNRNERGANSRGGKSGK